MPSRSFSQVERWIGGLGCIIHGWFWLIRWRTMCPLTISLIIRLIMHLIIPLIIHRTLHRTIHRTNPQTHQPEHQSTNIIVHLILKIAIPMLWLKMDILHQIRLGFIQKAPFSNHPPPPPGCGRLERMSGPLFIGKVLNYRQNFPNPAWFSPDGC